MGDKNITIKQNSKAKPDNAAEEVKITRKSSRTNKAPKSHTSTKAALNPSKPPSNKKVRVIEVRDSSNPPKSMPQPQTNEMKLPTVRKLHFKLSRVISVIVVVLIAAFCARVAIWEHFYLERMEGQERPTVSMPIEGEEDETDREEPTPTEVSEYTVAPDKPRYLSISSVGITNARVVEVGLKSDGALDTPYNIYDVGWYTSSSLPGSDGTTVIDGHGGAPGIGIFGNLTLVQPGTQVSIVMGDGRAYTYSIVDTATKALGDEANEYMATAFTSPERGKPSLTLITCTGEYWLSSRTYSHRFFARAVLVE